MASQKTRQSNWRKTKEAIIVNSTFTCNICGQQGHASINCLWKEEIQEMVRNKTKDHK